MLNHIEPDRTPVDFVAAPSVWVDLIDHFNLSQKENSGNDQFFEVSREQILQKLNVDCRVLSYDMFCDPPNDLIKPNEKVDWWGSLNRSTPNRMWRLKGPDRTLRDIWGIQTKIVETADSYYEGLGDPVLADAASLAELKDHPWPDADWWNFQALEKVIQDLDAGEEYHLRFRIGSIFEIAWQLRGMQKFLMEMVSNPKLPTYMMERITDICVANTERVLKRAGDRIDMLYFYDDVATQDSLLISPQMWKDLIYPFHSQLIAVARKYHKPVMYHCDGAVYPLISDLIEMGIDVLNPIQPDAPRMEPWRLKEEFGNQLSFHGGVNLKTLAEGSTDDVRDEVKLRVRVLGDGGGYILCSSHHIQHTTPVDNILAMYLDKEIRKT